MLNTRGGIVADLTVTCINENNFKIITGSEVRAHDKKHILKLIDGVTIPAGSSLEVLSGGKYVLQATDVLKIDCSVAAKLDATLSILEIT